MSLGLPLKLINLLQVQFQVQEVWFSCQPDSVTVSDLEIDYFFAYQHDYPSWTATSMCGCDNPITRSYQPSLVVCTDVIACLNVMKSLSLIQRLSNTFLAPTSKGSADMQLDAEMKLRLDDNLLTFDPGTGMVFEHYGIQGNNLKMPFGRWDWKDFSILKGESSKWERRSDLMGVELRATVLNWIPHSYQIQKHECDNEEATWRGYFIEAAEMLKTQLNFTFTYTSPSDKQWGVRKVTYIHIFSCL